MGSVPRPPAILVSFGSAGDLYPLIGLAQAFQAAGHRVTLLGTAVHGAAVARTEVPWRPVGDGEDYRRAMADPDLWHPRRGIRVLLRHYGAHLGQLLDQLRSVVPADAPCLVLCHAFGLPALDLLRAERPRMRVVGVHLAPASLRSVGDPMVWGPIAMPRWVGPGLRRRLWRWSDAHLVDPWGLPQVNPLRAAAGLPPVPHFLPHLADPADLSLTLFPPWFAPTQPDWHGPVIEGDFPLCDPHDDADALSPALQAFLAGGDAPLVFTPGSANVHAAVLFRRALSAVRRLGRRAVFLTPQRAQVPADLPPEVMWLPYVPLAALLPHAALLLHHGGIGTLAQALAAGVPQMVVPHGFDQFDNAHRLQRLGVARSCPVYRLYARNLARHLDALLADATVQGACRSAAARLASPNPAGRLADLPGRIVAQAAVPA